MTDTMMFHILDHGLDALFCAIIAYFAFEINRTGHIERLGKTAVYGIKTIMISAAAVPIMTILGLFDPMYLDVATYVSKIGINSGLVLTLAGHSKLVRS